MALIRAVFGWEGVSRMRADALTACRLIPAGHPAREVAALAVGCSLMLLGRTADAVPSLEEASALGEARPLASILARGVLAQIALEGGRLTRPRPAPERGSRSSAGLVSGRTPPAPPSAPPPRASAPAAVTSRGRASISSRGDRSSRGWRRHRGCRSGRALLGRVALTLGDLQLAGSLLDEARRGLAGYPDAGVLPRLLVRQERALEEAQGGGGLLGQPLTAAECRVLELLPTHLSRPRSGRRSTSRGTPSRPT